jgi:hypothetical protein
VEGGTDDWLDEDEDEDDEDDGGGGGGGGDVFDEEFGRMSIEDGRMHSGGALSAPARAAAALRQLQGGGGGGGRLERLPEAAAADGKGKKERGGDGGGSGSAGSDDDPGGGGAGGAGGGGGDKRGSGDRTPERETLHRLCPTYAADVNSPLRHVRTRIYFTSESHMHSLINVLRYCHLGAAADAAAAAAPGAGDGGGGGKQRGAPAPAADGGAAAAAPLLSDAGLALLDRTPELDYLTHVVLRMFEDKAAPLESPDRFFVEVLFSAGANRDPTAFFAEGAAAAGGGGGAAAAAAAADGGEGAAPLPHVIPPLPRVALHPGRGVSFDRASALLSRYAAARSPAAQPAYALKSALIGPNE